MTDGVVVGYWASAADRTVSSPSKTVTITSQYDYTVTASDYGIGGSIADWYFVAGSKHTGIPCCRSKLDVNIWAPGIAADVTGKSVTKGTDLQFGIVTNQYSALTTGRGPIYGNSTGDGYIDLKVRTESGSVLSQLYTSATSATWAPIGSINVTTQPYYWGQTSGLDNTTGTVPATAPFMWKTAATINGQPQYAPGTYTVWAESLLNDMKSKYTDASGATYTGKTVSAVKTITLVSDTVKITVNKDSVVRSKPFSVTITGRPSAYYCVWLKGVSSLDSALDDQPPLLTPFQAGVVAGETLCGNFQPQNMGSTVSGDVSHNNPPAGNDFSRWANVSTTTSGTRTVGFDTNNFTKAQKYTVMVQQILDGQYKTDQVDVKVEKGAVTIVAAGDQSYYLGEEVKFSGTNTESYTTYLFIIGPNLAPNGAQINEPRTAVPDNGAGMEQADVASDNTWSYKWGTSQLQLDAGTYTVYAVSQPVNKGQLSSVAYGTVSVIIKKPFVSATASQSTVAQGDKLFITGTAEGQPSSGVAIWIMGKNYAFRNTATVNSDSTFSYEVKQGDTQNLYAGQYFVVVQHPMQNDVFDITTNPQWAGGQITSPPAPSNVWVVNKQLGNQTQNPAGTNIFLLYGAGALQGSDAAEALVQAINDPNVDDTYTKLQFLVETGVINIVPIGDKHVGDKFTIKALTNLAVDDEILVQVYSSSFKPTQKSQSGEFSGATGTVKVTKGDSGMNSITFDVDASTFKPDEYIVMEEAVIQGTTGSALFNVLEGAAPTAVPTPVSNS